MDWKAYLGDQTAALGQLRSAAPEAAKAFGGLHDAILAEGALSVKTKELMSVAIGIQTHCLDCIGYHMKAAIRAGATREEVVETVGVCMTMGGGPAYMYGAKALAAYDAFTQKKG